MRTDEEWPATQAVQILRALAKMCEAGKSITIAPDWGYGSGTLINPEDGSHTHFGLDSGEDEEQQLQWFIDGLYNQLCKDTGLSWVKPEEK